MVLQDCLWCYRPLGFHVNFRVSFHFHSRLNNGPQRYPGTHAWSLRLSPYMARETLQMWLSKDFWWEGWWYRGISKSAINITGVLTRVGRGRFDHRRGQAVWQEWRGYKPRIPDRERHGMPPGPSSSSPARSVIVAPSHSLQTLASELWHRNCVTLNHSVCSLTGATRI